MKFNRIKDVLIDVQYPYRKLAKLMKMYISRMEKICRNECKPTIEELFEMSSHLNVSPRDLIYGNSDYMPKRKKEYDPHMLINYPELSQDEMIEKFRLKMMWQELPQPPKDVVYFLFYCGELVYIGKSHDYGVYGRIKQHKADKIFDQIKYIHVESELVTKVESGLINTTKTKYNKAPTGEATLQRTRLFVINYFKSKNNRI